MADVLRDVLAPDLRVVFCGTAAGDRSAEVGAYYARRGNRFWEILHRIGFTPCPLAPEEFGSLPTHQIGLTDLAKRISGTDARLVRGDFGVDGAVERLRPLRPYVLAFNGKKAASLWLGRRTRELDFGRTDHPHNTARYLFVLPSTSGAARRWWDEGPWRELAEFLKVPRPDFKNRP